MKKTYPFHLLLLMCCLAITACKKKTTESSKVETTKATKAPYIVTFEEVPSDFAPALQSFAFAQVGSKLLVVGGRTNGFHNFSGISSIFTPKRSNTYFYVIDLDSSKTDSLPIPQQYYYQLRSTNMQSYLDGNTLYCIGGYGSNSNVDSPPANSYQTYPNLTAINVSQAIAAIKSQNSALLQQSISTTVDENMRVTGGELHKIGDWFYLVFGQNYNTIYTGATGIYTNQVRRFQINNSGATPQITGYAYDTCTWDDSSFHRRDLVVAETIMQNGTQGITVYGGVFSPNANAPYSTPIYIAQTSNTNGATNITTNNNFNQQFCQYAAANFSLYNPTTNTTATTILGGISQYFYQGDTPVNGGIFALPFINTLTTITRNADGSSTEFPQPTPAMPGYLGAEAIFVRNYKIPIFKGSSTVIDHEQLLKSADKTEKGYLMGYMYGGIEFLGTDPATQLSITKASKRIFKVYLTPNL